MSSSNDPVITAVSIGAMTGVSVEVLAPDLFGGEHERRSWIYASLVYVIALLAAATNIAKALYRKRRQRGTLRQVLWSMGRDPRHTSSIFGDGLSRYNHLAKVGAAGWRSLDLFYNYHEKIKPALRRNIEGWLTHQWIGKCENRQAVTNRLKLAIDLLARSFDDFASEKEIRLLSIASGSAQAVVEALKQRPQLNVNVLLLDPSETALAEAKALATRTGLDNRFTYAAATTRALEEVAGEFKPHIVEMIGLLDYRPRHRAITLIDRIRRLLPSNGIFLTANIHPNREKIFLDWILLWPMIYRTESEFAELLVYGGFAPDKVRLIYEPFHIHGIAVCKKS